MLTNDQIRTLNDARTILKHIYAPDTRSGGILEDRCKTAEWAVFQVLNALNAHRFQDIPDRLLLNKENPDEPRSLGRVEDVKVVADEYGFELHLETEHGSFVCNIHAVTEQMLQAVQKELGSYWEDARQMAAEYERERTADDDAAEGYDPLDPKSDGYHDRMSALADNR